MSRKIAARLFGVLGYA